MSLFLPLDTLFIIFATNIVEARGTIFVNSEGEHFWDLREEFEKSVEANAYTNDP